MLCSRREGLLAFLAALPSVGLAAEKAALPSKAYPFEDLRVERSGDNSFRPVLEGLTHSGCQIEIHETDLAPGGRPHPPHHHLHEEMFLIRDGTLEVTINGRSTKLGPGSVAFVASNDQHGIRNAGDTQAQYFVIGLGTDR
ncbi:MAG: cupin domain-containing protein [Acidobacteriia bacterium]|nr:cupin domain-containing protein [Terriglobia bacterium]